MHPSGIERNLTCHLRAVGRMGDSDRVICEWKKDVPRSLVTALETGSYRPSSILSA